MIKLLTAFSILAGLTGSAQNRADSFFLARSAGKLTMLASSPGDDRLGGAKIGYIDTGILLRIIDSTADLYTVQLSDKHKTFVNKADVKRDTVSRLRGFYLTNSFSVKGDDQFDYVNINLDEKLPYKSWMETDPSKIMIDLFGAQSNTNWITQLKTAEEIENVSVNQVEDDVVRVTILLKHRQHWGYTIRYINKLLSIRVRRQPDNLKLNKLLIGVDAGHGGSNVGSTGAASRSLEKNYTLRYANELVKYLQSKGASTVTTRNSDTTLSNVDRLLMLQNALPNVVISLHFNSSANPAVKGVSTYYKPAGYRTLAKSILNRLLELNLNEFGEVGNFNFTLNAATDFPNALVEIAFLSNADDEKKIVDPRFERAVAKKIYKGLKDWLHSINE